MAARLPSTVTALYRFFNNAGALLYIGISNTVPKRLGQHEGAKTWYHEVVRITVEHHPDRPTALAFEERAIKAERPKYNIQHNRGRIPDAPAGAGRWTFESLRSGYERTIDLYLLGELDCSAMVDDYYELDGEGQLEQYVQYLGERYPQWLAADAVPILWTVAGKGTFEHAPFQSGEFATGADGWPHADFLTEFTWPYDAETGEQLDWFKLPVRIDRFPEFAQALDWLPSALQPTCPLRSILASRSGIGPTRGVPQ